MISRNRLKQRLVDLRMFILADFPFLITLFYKYCWRPKRNSLAEVLDKFSRSRKEVFAIQVGSNDGFQHDPLCKFIKRDRWRGLLLEPQKIAYQTLTYIYKNDEVTPINKALDARDCHRKLFRIALSNARWATGLSSFKREQLQQMISSGHIRRKSAQAGIVLPANTDDWIAFDWIQCVSFETLIAEHKVERIDLLHIDTEGFDYEILKLFPFTAFQPQVVVYEHSHLSDEDKRNSRAYLSAKGYQLKEFGADTIGVRNVDTSAVA